MSKIVKISTDSTADLSGDLIKKYGVNVVPLHVEMDGKSYSDGIDIHPSDLYEYYEKTGKIAHSSAVNVGEYTSVFEKLTADGAAVVHIALGDFLSSSYQNAVLAADEFENVFVINSKNLSTGIGLVVLKAAELAAEGHEASEIAEICKEAVERLDVSFILETVDYLHAGGRCSGVAKFGANLLQIKPSIVVTKTGMVVGKKFRGKINDCRIKYIEDQLGDASDIELDRIFFTHSGIDKESVDLIIEKIKSIAPFKEVIETTAGCVISCHCGPGCGGVLFFRKPKN